MTESYKSLIEPPLGPMAYGLGPVLWSLYSGFMELRGSWRPLEGGWVAECGGGGYIGGDIGDYYRGY